MQEKRKFKPFDWWYLCLHGNVHWCIHFCIIFTWKWVVAYSFWWSNNVGGKSPFIVFMYLAAANRSRRIRVTRQSDHQLDFTSKINYWNSKCCSSVQDPSYSGVVSCSTVNLKNGRWHWWLTQLNGEHLLTNSLFSPLLNHQKFWLTPFYVKK